MNEQLYIGKTVREFIKDVPSFMQMCYIIYGMHICDILENDRILDSEILSISHFGQDYTSIVKIKLKNI